MRGNNTVPIPGELVSVAVNGVVSSADGIYDYQQSKSQETLNSELVTAGTQLARRVGDVETAQSTLSTSITNTVNSRLDTFQSNVDTSISENNQLINGKVTQINNKMSEVEQELSTTRADNLLTRNAIASLDPDQQAALAIATQVQTNTSDIEDIQDKQGGLSLVVLTEAQYESQRALDSLDQNTLYFVKEQQ